jgi:hypothetical protein
VRVSVWYDIARGLTVSSVVLRHTQQHHLFASDLVLTTHPADSPPHCNLGDSSVHLR